MIKSKFLAITGIALLALSSCDQSGKPQMAHKAAPFLVQTVEKADVTIYKEYAANIEGEQNVEIRSKVDGFIEKIYIDEGATVRKGQLMFKLSAETLNQQLNAAKANIEVAKSQVEVSQVELEKIRPLVEMNIISGIELKTATSKLNAAKAQLNAVEANYLNAKENLDYTIITSPVDGIVGSIPYKVGSLVGRNEAMALTTVSNINNVYAYFSMNEKQLLEFIRSLGGNSMAEKIGQMPEVELSLADGSLYNHKGKIETINGMVNPRTGSVNYRAKFPNSNRLLRNGNSGRIKFPTQIKSAILLPEKSTFELQGKRFVYVVGEGDKVNSKEVIVSETVGNNIIVQSGIKAGEVIVHDGLIKLREGMQIMPNSVDLAVQKGLNKEVLSDK
ncbi:efflux RND transporter periplasmic adaptor subunit [Ancylomarina euxinus]|uniref:Efflux RND transporter periplasmic adaptor subunit n=1 Tax=Ancylomarina euxinus TaxID=2283627 RepID=A0A425Y061_9BACT|nr:efflux RND transporter periplasmic adaptor subunit [Ancylomarina euxinus]MCZ4695217.1 efflux RND transporter periplasmic adaptor subunit [Ancylomarina euxinus]MUP15414.1 efflux RND transporter periplasmic adaptor subunit [Ancylomarina euxinus]RRG21124.1 efflux RND transporter periplasmic adaptor subunit [Ancylomarina euxinus]